MTTPDPFGPTDPAFLNPGAVSEVLADHTDRLDDLEAWRTHQTALVTELRLGTGAPEIGPVHQHLDLGELIGWVHTHVAAVIARPLRGEHFWCLRWWEHPEAIFRLEACRRAWTELAGEPGCALSTWIRDHLDPCLNPLLSPTGPFVDCPQSERYRATSDHRPLPTLPVLPPQPSTAPNGTEDQQELRW